MKKMNNKGFSLVELIIVIAIMAILAAALAPQLIKYLEQSRNSTDRSSCDTIKSCFNAAIANEDAYKIASGGTVTSINFATASDLTGDDLMDELAQSLADVSAPASTGSVEYSIQWDVSGGAITNVVVMVVDSVGGTTAMDDADGNPISTAN